MDKPYFNYFEGVEVDYDQSGVWRKGRIKGLASQHVVDIWIVELDEFPPNWPYKALGVPHTLIRPYRDTYGHAGDLR